MNRRSARLLARWRTPRAGSVEVSSAYLGPGISLLPDRGDGALCIEADDVVVDGPGVVLDGGGRGGIGIVLAGRRRVTLRNRTVRGQDELMPGSAGVSAGVPTRSSAR